jgi:hypothetical protein
VNGCEYNVCPRHETYWPRPAHTLCAASQAAVDCAVYSFVPCLHPSDLCSDFCKVAAQMGVVEGCLVRKEHALLCWGSYLERYDFAVLFGKKCE